MAKYPHSNVKKWVKEDGNYEAAFDLNKVETTITLNSGGSILETETDITTANLPKATADYLAKNFAGKKIKEASKIIDPKGVVTYEAEVDGKDYTFDANGNFIK